MNRKISSFFGFILLATSILCPEQPSANPAWSSLLSQWDLYIDNNVIYVASSNMPGNCNYERAEVSPGTALGNSIYAFALKSQALGKPIRVVTDNAVSRCVITGIQNN